jgi:LysR family transcriptional regulator, low CO2-responsive transcriptional regulator
MAHDPLPHLETFAEAAERGSFTAAAKHLGISQAAVSQRIQQLETAIKSPLFRREGGRVTLTTAGRRLHDYARRILDLIAEARAEVTGTPGEVTGELRLAASSVPGQHILPHSLATFRKKHPGVQVKVTVSDTDAVLHEVEQGTANLGFVGGPGGGPHLEFRRFATDELVVVVPKKHPWGRRKWVTPAELTAQPLIQREAGSGSRHTLEHALEQAGVRPTSLNVVLELGSSEAITGAVVEGLGAAVLSRRAVQDDVRAGRLHTLAVEGVALERDLYVVRDRRRVLSPAAQSFLTVLRPDPPVNSAGDS